MLVPWKALNMLHITPSQYNKGTEQKRRWLEKKDMRESAVRDFQYYRRPIKMVTSFNYLERFMTALDDNCLAVVGNLQKVQKIWYLLKRILGREGARPRVSGMFFKTVVQALLLFGLETWVMILYMGQDLLGLQYIVARRFTGRQPKRQVDTSWYYPLL